MVGSMFRYDHKVAARASIVLLPLALNVALPFFA